MKNPFKTPFTLKSIWEEVVTVFVIGVALGIGILVWMVLWYISKWLWGGD